MYPESLKYNPSHCRLDLYFASNEMRPLLVGDFKLDDFEYAKVQTFGYCMAIVNEVCVKNSSLPPIKMFEADPKDSNQMKQFIKVLMFAINTISIYYCVEFEVEPQRGLILTTPFYMVLKEFISQIKRSINFTTEINLKIKRHSDWI